MTSTLKLSAPHVVWIKKLEKFFEEDPDVTIEYDPNFDPERVNILVDDPEKYYALDLVMEPEMIFGNIHLLVSIIPANFTNTDKIALFKKVFSGNPIVDSIDIIQPEGTTNPFCYVSFRNQVVKFWADNLGNPHGNMFTLFETLADDIFPYHDGILFTTAED